MSKNRNASASIEQPKGKLGVLLVGLGAVSTTFIAGVAAIKRGIAEPIGSSPVVSDEREVAMMKELQFAAILCVTVGVLAASAQSPPQTSQPDPKACAPGERLEPPGRQQSPSDTTGQADNNPSERLERTDGVLCPPSNVDPQIRAPTPDAGTLKVIPPPGTPGGKSDIRPK